MRRFEHTGVDKIQHLIAERTAAMAEPKRRYFRGDAASANPEIYEFLEAEGLGYTIRRPANSVLRGKVGYLLKRPVGRPSHEVRRYYASFTYRAGSWTKPRREVAKVEWHPGELYPRGGFIVSSPAQPAERIVAFDDHRGTCEQCWCGLPLGIDCARMRSLRISDEGTIRGTD